MKKIRLLLISFLLTGFTSVAQNNAIIDSLKNDLSKSSSFSEEIELYNDLAWQYRKYRPDSTIYFAQQALKKSIDFESKKLVAKPLNFIGLGHYYKGNEIKAYEYFNMAKDSALIYNDSTQYAHSLNSIGRIYFNQGNYISAYDYFFRALDIFDDLDNQEGLSYGYKSLSELYKQQNNYDKALEMSLKTAEIRENEGDPSSLISIYLEIADIYKEIRNFNNALDYFSKAYEIAEQTNDDISLATIKLGIADLNTERGEFNIALLNANEALNYIEETGNQSLLLKAYFRLGVIYYFKNELTTAKSYFVRIISSELDADIGMNRDCYYYLSKIAERNDNVTEAFDYYKQYSGFKEKTDNVNAARQIERLESRLQIQQKETENKLLKLNEQRYTETIQQQRSFNYLLITLIIVIIILLAGVTAYAQKRKKHNKELLLKNEKINQQQLKISEQNIAIKEQNQVLLLRNEKLDEINNEKDTVLNIVAHDMKSPFHRIKGLTELLRLSSLNEEQKQYVQMIRDNAKHGMYLINDLLDVSAMEVDENKPVPTNINLKPFLNKILDSFVIELTNKQIRTSIECEEDVHVVTDHEYLSRIIENLVSNAIKFSALEGEIVLGGGKNNEKFWVSVKDYGQGFSEADRDNLFKKFKKLSATPTAGESSNGLGLAIVKTLTDRLNGKITLDSVKGEFSEFTLHFPILLE